jgi:Acetyltransferase (GNAT) domain
VKPDGIRFVQLSRVTHADFIDKGQPGAFSRSSCRAAEVRIVDPRRDPTWERDVLSHAASSLFHRTAWANVLSRTYGHEPTYLYLSRDRKVVGLVPMMEIVSPFTGRRGVSLPFSDFCSPLWVGDRKPDTLMDALSELGRQRGWRYFELRGGKEMLPESAIAAERYYGHKLDLTVGVNVLFGRFRGSVRRAIRRAEKSGLAVVASKTWEAMKDFYRLHVLTRRRHGLPPQPLSFFRNIHEEVIKNDLGFVVLARIGQRPIAAAVFFHSGQEALYKFGASDKRPQQLRGNNLVMWEGIKQLAERGLKTLYFGRTAINDEGLRRFKLSWGSEENLVEYFRFALGHGAWEVTGPNGLGFYHQLFRRLPLLVNRVAGTLMYSHLD